MSKTIVRYENDWEIQYIRDQHILNKISKDNPKQLVDALDENTYNIIKSFGYGIICTHYPNNEEFNQRTREALKRMENRKQK